MGIGDGLQGFMGARFDRILEIAGRPMTILRTPAVEVTGYIDQVLPDRDLAPKAHEYDLILRAGDPSGAPLRAGELVRDQDQHIYLVRVLRRETPVSIGQLWRCNTRITVFRFEDVIEDVSGITSQRPVAVAIDEPCRISVNPAGRNTQREGRPDQTEGRWVTDEEFSIAAREGILQAGDEVEAPGWPRLKVGRPSLGDAGDPSWEVPARPAIPRGVPGQEV